ncbi:hypothetical protein EKO23_14835 [Nocardioides guangzhouensis]|uniref:Uncharacterized protein n=1 Tax=Nocardioides guangzhouensis TaxID=2497878 RepID=A0A4Q4ZBX2_9ACTN|nr:hypothetical protein [Nocardioides guangzhouensis]RYP84786.1 hypothetical protein EKO23_14835 [Nocardioides guangzhouensis]
MLVGLLIVALSTVILSVGFGALWLFLCHQGEVGEAVLRAARRLHLARPEPEVLPNRPLQAIARDLRRVHRLVQAPGPGESALRRTARLAAYDDLLLQACRALDVPDLLTGVTEGTERDAERLHLQFLLAEAGLDVDPPAQAA